MAAKQGLTAQIYQASEDTKRSILSRAPAGIKTHSWLSNLNTTCTIKSAPPRTPEVMSLLSSKCGWLVKRNEQRVWQKRWCCVVPHTFLYYFEAGPEVEPDEDGNYEGWSGGGITVKGTSVHQVIAVGPLVFQNLDQDALNVAVKEGYDEDCPISKNSYYASLSHLPFSGINEQNDIVAEEDGENFLSTDWEETPLSMDAEHRGKYKFVPSNLQPVGIIDLECYSAVNRSKINPTVMELAGDAITNPDLRAFYFQSATIEDAESWTKALLSDRHQSLKDETDAYRQVCESFPLQLQACSDMIDAAESKAAEMEREAYSVRSASEEGRRKVVATVREVLDHQCWEKEAANKQRANRNGIREFNDIRFPGRNKSNRNGRGDFHAESNPDPSEQEPSLLDSVFDEQYMKLETNREAFLRDLEATLSNPSAVSTSNVVPPVQTLADYTVAIISSFTDMRVHLQKYEKDLTQSVQQDQTELNKLKSEIKRRDDLIADAEKKHSHMSHGMKSQLEDYQREVEELTKQLDGQRMEFGMYQNATKNKLSELHQHKKILKKEVIELRKKIDECESETTTLAHRYEKITNSYQAEKERNATLERYIERLEKQVGVQQNMMEMMSQTGGASFVGKMVGPGITQCESKDAISLSGISVGSHARRASSGNSVGPGGQMSMGGTMLQKPRTLLPPDSSKHNKLPPDMSSLCSKKKYQEENIGDIAVEERDASTNYRSETTTEAESPGKYTDMSCSKQSRPSISTDNKEMEAEDERLSPLGLEDPVLATRSTESMMKSPVSSSHSSKRAPSYFEASQSVVPPSSNPDESSVSIGKETSSSRNIKDLPVLDSSLQEAMDKFPAVSNYSPTDPDEEEDIDDVKSRFSDITEDRTQRQIDDDLAERRKILLAYVHGNAGGSPRLSMSASTKSRLETIGNMMPNNGAGGSRSGLLSRVGSIGSMDSPDPSSTGSGRLSVAQRARLEADNRSNTHRTPSPIRLKEDLAPTSNNKIPMRSASPAMRAASPVMRAASPVVRTASPAPIERTGSFLSKIGKVIGNVVDNSVLGVKSWDSEYDDDDDRSGSEAISENTSTTLQKRIAMQRQKQLEFLKNKGLIDDESSLRGGAGGSSIVSPRGVHTPTRQATPRRSVGRRW